MQLISLDVETTLDVCQKLRVITICKSGGEPEIVYRYDSHGDTVPPEVVKLLNESACIMHNAMFDVGVLAAHGITLGSVWCTFHAELVISSQAQKIGLLELVKKYCKIDMVKDEQRSDWGQELTENQISYCYEDVRYLEQIFRIQHKYLTETEQLPYVSMMNEVIKVWAVDQYYGFPRDLKVLEDIKAKCNEDKQIYFEELMGIVKPTYFLSSNYSIKGVMELLRPFASTDILPDKIGKEALAELFESGVLDAALKEAILFNPDHKVLTGMSSGSFAKKCAIGLGVELKSHGEASVTDFKDRFPNHPFSRIIEILLKMRKIDKILSTYAELKPERTYVDNDGMTRTKFKQDFTVTGRWGLDPIARIPRKGSNEYGDTLRDSFLPPKGYTILASDFKSLEDHVAGIIFNDESKLKAVNEGFDLHLMFAQKLFKCFDYNSPDQTDELKKKFKSFRTAVKSINFAAGYGARAKKLDGMIQAAFEKEGIDMEKSGEEFLEAWGETFPAVKEAQDFINERVTKSIKDTYNSFNYAKPERQLMNTWTFDRESPAYKLRTKVLMDSRLCITVGSVLGLKNIIPAHKTFAGLTLNGRGVDSNNIFNHIIQSSATHAMWLSLLMVKKLFPSIIIGAEIHDSLILFVPEKGIGDLTLEDIKTSIAKIMGLAGYILFGAKLGADPEILSRGW